MIHNSSTDPVLIKKISLKIWSLRDEIESRIKLELTNNPDAEINVDELKKQFSKSATAAAVDNVIPLKPNEELDTSEDEMAKAMRGEATEEEADSANKEESNVVPMGTEANNVINITVDAPEIAEEKLALGKTVLSEINMDKMFLFCNKPYTEGQSIVIQFCIPRSFIINADVIYCRSFNLKNRIISKNNYNYRVLVKFTFLKEGERALLRQFIQSIEPEVQKVEKKEETKEEEGFNELDDLGL